MGRIKCHLHPILCTWDAVTTCSPVTVFFPLGVWLCSKKKRVLKPLFSFYLVRLKKKKKRVLQKVCVTMGDRQLHGVRMPVGVGGIVGNEGAVRKDVSSKNTKQSTKF